MSKETHYFRCSCSFEVLALEWLDDDKKELCVSIYEHPKKTTWRWRIKQAINVLCKGTPYGDQLILDRSALSGLSSFFESHGRRKRREKERDQLRGIVLENGSRVQSQIEETRKRIDAWASSYGNLPTQ